MIGMSKKGASIEESLDVCVSGLFDGIAPDVKLEPRDRRGEALADGRRARRHRLQHSCHIG